MTPRVAFHLAALALMSAWLAFACSAHADPGIWVDDFTVSNDGKVVFSDNFDDGDIRDWMSVRDCTVSCKPPPEKSCCLHANWTGGAVACAYHRVDIERAGLVRLEASVWLPPIADQKHDGFTGLYLASGNTQDSVYVGPKTDSKTQDYKLILRYVQIGGKGTLKTVASPELKPGVWTKIAVELNYQKGTATAFVNGKELASVPYPRGRFYSISKASVWGWLGQGK